MKLPVAALFALASLAVATPSWAQGAAETHDTSTSIDLAGRTIMRIRAGAAGYTAEQRAAAVRERLIPILSMPHLVPSDVTVQMVSPMQSNIEVRGHLLLTVDESLAKSNGQTPQQLAQGWAANLRQALPTAGVSGGPQYRHGHI